MNTSRPTTATGVNAISMAERVREQPNQASPTKPWEAHPALAWLGQRLLPRGAAVMNLAAYAIILTALIVFVLQSPGLPLWRIYSTILALAALLVVSFLSPDIEALFHSKKKAQWTYLFLSTILTLLANWLGVDGHVSFLPFLFFVLTGTAFIDLRFRYALLYAIGLLVCWMLILLSNGLTLVNVLSGVTSIGLGMIFTMSFALVMVRFSEQTARANRLLNELQIAHAELAAAREREKDLAVAEERVRLARDIHDGLGHHLTVLNVQLQAAAKLIDRDPGRVVATIATCREEAQAALDEVRRSVAAMRRSPLDGRTLDEALPALVRDFDRHSPLAARFEQHGATAPLTPAAAMTLYRAAQEGLTNVQKHAVAQRVTVTLDYAPERVYLAVRDDGSAAGSMDAGGFGLAGLRERAEQLGGTFHAAPQPDGGFLLEMVLPISCET